MLLSLHIKVYPDEVSLSRKMGYIPYPLTYEVTGVLFSGVCCVVLPGRAKQQSLAPQYYMDVMRGIEKSIPVACLWTIPASAVSDPLPRLVPPQYIESVTEALHYQ